MATSPLPALLASPQLVLLDRDGVINFDSPDYIKSPAEWRALPGSLNAIARLNAAGILVGLCSNQSGVGQGLFSAAALTSIQQKLIDELGSADGHLDHVGICPHAPWEGCACRKPAPGLLLEALKTLAVEPGATLFVGDSLRDLQAAQAAGVQPVLVRTGNGAITETTLKGRDDEFAVATVFDDLAATVDALLDQGTNAALEQSAL